MSTVITDASFCPQTKAAGWAAWIRLGKGKLIKRSGVFKIAPKDCTEAELWAAYNGIHIAKAKGAEKVLLQTDCLAAINVIKKNKTKNEKGYLELRHVKGHTNFTGARYWVNRWCDREAKKQMRKQRKIYES
jgi:ribonuclease HI